MKSTKDRSHGTNVINFGSLIGLCQSLGTRYSPQQDKMKVTYLQSRLPATKALMLEVEKKLTADTEARGRRRLLFEAVAPKAARVVALFSLCTVNATDVKAAKSVLKKMQGKKLTAPKKKETEGSTPSGTTEVVQHEASQQSFMFMVQHFQKLIEIVSLAPDYNPSELDMKLPALQAYLTQLNDANDETSNTGLALDKARINRDRDLYRNGDGIVKIAKEVKKYITAVWGRGSEQSQQASSLLFIDFKFVELAEVVPDPS